ncbi:unnamed protein product, partial [Echinostoma caproni]|uniref:RRM domain-containing protein n=1 Tax=Echinostoma caproni TaxID=27848 RepID=A0A183A1V8_9TREM
MSANASNIRRFFVGLAIPEGGVHIVGGNDGDAFIAFATDEDARKAMLLDRQTINGAPVRLFLSSKTEMQSVIESARSSALYTGIATTPSLPPVPQKTEAMQAMDVTAPTLPSSFPSYRNGTTRDSFSEGRSDQFSYPGQHSTSPPPVHPLDPPVSDLYAASNVGLPPRIPERSIAPESLPLSRDYDYNHQPHAPFVRYDEVHDRLPVVPDYPPPRDHSGPSNPPPDHYRSYYDDPVYDRRTSDNRLSAPSKDPSIEDPRSVYGNTRYARNVPDPRHEYDKPQTPPRPLPDHALRDGFPREPEISRAEPTYPPYQPPDRNRPPPSFDRQQPPFVDPRGLTERDFSVRPPWLNEDATHHGSKRPFQPQPEFDDYGVHKKRVPPPPPTAKVAHDTPPMETDFIVRLAVPVSEVGVKPVFDILRGVHIVPKWGIRIEEDSLQRPTGYIFIMVTDRESLDRALSYDGRPYKGKNVKVIQSNLAEFYRVTDSNFRSKCPPEIIKKLPSPGERFTPPYYADGCLEVAELPPDTTCPEVVRFLGAPGLSPGDVVIATFAPSDKAAPANPKSVRALVILPSAKDIQILLSAKPRPLRPDGAFPPVRLSPISRLQFEAFSVHNVDSKSTTNIPKTEKPSDALPVESNKSTESEPLTCAFLSGLSRYLIYSEVLRLFPSVLIPGDAIRMVPPEQTSAYIDFISENNCRRALTDITGKDSKAKLAHPNIHIEAISRSEMESRLENVPKQEEPHTNERSVRHP